MSVLFQIEVGQSKFSFFISNKLICAYCACMRHLVNYRLFRLLGPIEHGDHFLDPFGLKGCK